MRYAPITPSESRELQSDNGAAARPQKRVRLACQRCRQSKLRCDSSGVERPCARCERLDIECIYDNAYQRQNKRAKIDELVDEVQQLRSVLQMSGRSPEQSNVSNISSRAHAFRQGGQSSSNISLPAASPSGTLGHQSSATPIDIPQPPVQDKRKNATAAQQSRQLDDTTLEPFQIDHLFDVYFASYHSFFPILDPSASPDEYHFWSPALFWIIICIAARRDNEDATLMAILGPSVCNLAFQTIGCPPHNRSTIKAWVLFCLWSLPTNSMTTDPSFILASAAKASAMHVGLHRPEIVQDFSRVKVRFGLDEMQDAVRTWVGCFIAAECVTNYIGQPSLYGPDHVLDFLAANSHTKLLPDEIMVLMRAFRFSNRVASAMNGNEGQSRTLVANETSVLLCMLDQDLSELCNATSIRSNAAEMIVLYVSLQFRSYYFFEQTPKPRKEGLLKGYAAALSLASKGRELQANSQFLSYAPNMYQQSIILAAIFIIKIAKSSYRHDIDIGQAKKSFGMCHTLIKQMSLEDNDLRGRAAKIFEQLWNSNNTDQLNSEPFLRIHSRLGGNLLHDAIWTWRETFGGQKAEQASGSRNAFTHSTPSTLEEASHMASGDANPETIQATSKASQNLDLGQSLANVQDMSTIGDLNNIDGLMDQTLSTAASQPDKYATANTASGLDANFDIALLPNDYLDSFWDIPLDALFPPNATY